VLAPAGRHAVAGDVAGVERDLPQRLEAEHVLHPEQRRLHGLEVRRQVIDVREPEAVAGAGPGSGGTGWNEPGEQRLIAAPLDEAEGGVAERRRDREHGQAAAVVAKALHVGDERAAALVQQAERAVDVLDLQHHRPDPLGVLAQVAPGAATLADRLQDHEHRAAGLERRRPLPPLAVDGRAAGAELDEVHPVDEEPARPLEVVHVVVQRLDLRDAERLARGHWCDFTARPRAPPVGGGRSRFARRA